jgi:hypothetical protein
MASAYSEMQHGWKEASRGGTAFIPGGHCHGAILLLIESALKSFWC